MRHIDASMILTIRTSLGVPKTVLTSFFSRYFSSYHAFQYDKESYANLRLIDPQAYKKVLASRKAYYEKTRQDPVAWRKILDQKRSQLQRWRQDPDNRAKIHAARGRFQDARMQDERYRFYLRLSGWCHRRAWVREQLPWKSYRPVLYDNKVEHYCDGCNWTTRGGKKLWWKKIETSPAADSGSWLCAHCYVPTTDWAQALPEGYEDLGLTTIKEITKRRDSLGHGD